MRILINDFVQDSDAPTELKSAALADIYQFTTSIIIDLGSSKTIDCIGIGNTDGVNFTVNGQPVTFTENGLYILSTSITAQNITVGYDGSFVGRIALGLNRKICTIPAKEPGFYSTYQNRETISGQIIPGAGGITGRKIGVDVRYRITQEIYNDFTLSYPSQIGRGFPFFINFLEESFKLPFQLFYGGLSKSDLTFQNAINKFIYSKRFDFIERF
jgi:hypothetical protein